MSLMKQQHLKQAHNSQAKIRRDLRHCWLTDDQSAVTVDVAIDYLHGDCSGGRRKEQFRGRSGKTRISGVSVRGLKMIKSPKAETFRELWNSIMYHILINMCVSCWNLFRLNKQHALSVITATCDTTSTEITMGTDSYSTTSVWRKGSINKNCLCVTVYWVLCTIIMVHKDTSSSYRSVDCIGLWSCLV